MDYRCKALGQNDTRLVGDRMQGNNRRGRMGWIEATAVDWITLTADPSSKARHKEVNQPEWK